MLQALLILFVLVLATGSPVMAREATTHSGRIVRISRDVRTVTLEEIVAWTGPETGRVKRTFGLTPSTSIRLLRRAADTDAAGWPGDFQTSPLAPSDLKPGDFATVTAERARDQVRVLSIDVVRPGSQ